MLHIDEIKCTGCGKCVEICPQQAITIDRDRAVISGQICTGCGICLALCSAGAIRELEPVSTK